MSAVDTEWMGSQDTHTEVNLTKVIAAFLGHDFGFGVNRPVDFA